MNAAERLRAIIKERQEWEAFGWGPVFTAWAGVLVAKGVVEALVGPGVAVGSAAYALGLVVQAAFAVFGKASPGLRQATMHAFWSLVAVSAWFFGTVAPVVGGMEPAGARVLELFVVAIGLVMVGFVKERRSLVVGAAALVLGSLGLAVVPGLAPWTPLVVAATFGVASVVAWAHDRTKPSQPL